jgi:peptidoglycan/LPS O-acetylase OafA/YrhL
VNASGSDPGAVPDAVAPPPHHKRFPLADGVRGVAAFSIVVVHAWLFTGGFEGFTGSLENRAVVRLDSMVSTFFLLSAFLLYRPMIAHRAGGPGAPRVADYARRRFLRIYPAYWLALTVLAIVPGLVGVFSSHWWSFYSLAFYLDPLFNSSVCPPGQTFACGLPQSWTLTTEVTFYAILPLYAAAAALLARGRDVRSWVRAELVLLAALAALSVFLNMGPLGLRTEPWFRATFAGHFYWLALGLGLAVISVAYPRRSELPRALRAAASRPGLCWAAAVAIYLVTIPTLPPAPFIVADETNSQYLATHLLQGAIAILILIPVLLGDPNAALLRRVLGNRVILWLGLISYGFYLWHVTIAYDLGFGGADAGFGAVLVLTLLLAIPLAGLSYYLVERPLMRLKYRSVREVLGGRRLRRTPSGARSG